MIAKMIQRTSKGRYGRLADISPPPKKKAKDYTAFGWKNAMPEQIWKI